LLQQCQECYDCITLLAAALCLCRLGCPFSVADSMISTIHEMNHHICTTYGNSKISSSRLSWQAPIAGISQGMEWGPSQLSHVQYNALRWLLCTHYILHFTTDKKLVGFAFVDDTDLCVFGPTIHCHNITQVMQQSVDNWEGLLHATGGTLVLNKCFWYLLDFRFDNNHWVYTQPNQSPGKITIKDNNLRCVKIPRLNPSEAQ